MARGRPRGRGENARRAHRRRRPPRGRGGRASRRRSRRRRGAVGWCRRGARRRSRVERDGASVSSARRAVRGVVASTAWSAVVAGAPRDAAALIVVDDDPPPTFEVRAGTVAHRPHPATNAAGADAGGAPRRAGGRGDPAPAASSPLRRTRACGRPAIAPRRWSTSPRGTRRSRRERERRAAWTPRGGSERRRVRPDACASPAAGAPRAAGPPCSGTRRSTRRGNARRRTGSSGWGWASARSTSPPPPAPIRTRALRSRRRCLASRAR